MLKVENVSKTYKGEKVLNKISFTVPEGEIYSLVGAFGEGKTTLINMIIGFETVDEGNIYVKGTDCQLSPDRARKLFGYVPDVFPSYPTMTLKEYMKFFGRLMDDSDYEKIKHLTVNLLGFVGLSDEIDKRISKLNRIQKQKLSIARALLHNPKLIVLDEPFWGLDVDGVREIKEILDFLHQQGRTIFMTSENLQLAASLSTSVGIMENGTMLYGDKTKEAYDSLRTNSVQLQHTGYLDQKEISRQLHEAAYSPEEERSRQLQHTGYLPEEEISRQLHEVAYLPEEEISRQLQHTGYLPEEEISRQLHDIDYTVQEELSTHMDSLTYTEKREISKQLDVDEEDDESISSLADLGLDIDDDYTPNFEELEYVSNIQHENYIHDDYVYTNLNEATKMPYEHVQAIESTKQSEDISRRILYDDNSYDQQSIKEKPFYDAQKVVSRRGMVEKRGVGGSRVVTDKNNYKNKNK